MPRRAARFTLVLSLLAAAARAQDEEAATVERVEVLRSQFLQAETLLFYVSTKAGDRYDAVRIKDDFRRLWDTGFLDDLRVDVADGASGKIVTFTVQERRRVQLVDYRGGKTLSTSAIEEELKKKEAQVRLDSFYGWSRSSGSCCARRAGLSPPSGTT
jgi:outer membrane protein insertion porin family